MSTGGQSPISSAWRPGLPRCTIPGCFIAHFGFRLRDPGDIDAAVRVVEDAGGRVLARGEFVPGEPYLFFRDLDGYEVEIWFEIPTAFDLA